VRELRLALALAAAAALIGCSCSNDDEGNGNGLVDGRVVFVGASITESWDFDHYFGGRDFRKVIHFDVDKTQVWDQVETQTPEICVVKECAAYFYTGGGTPLNEYHGIVQTMVANCRAAGITPVLATTVPVDVGFGGCTQAQLDDIRAFNSWLRSYCAAQNIVCMDLYDAIADAQGQLPTNCHDGDGLHPNSAGYDKLSPVVLPALTQAGL
jgi:hypothetical protein